MQPGAVPLVTTVGSSTVDDVRRAWDRVPDRVALAAPLASRVGE